MPQDDVNSQNQPPQQPPQDDPMATLRRLLGGYSAPQQQPTPGQGSAGNPSFMYQPIGGSGATVAMPFGQSDFVDPATLGRVRGMEGPTDYGPYGATPQGEAQAGRQYQSMAQSPYMLFGANNRFAQNHPRLAGMADNALLAGSSTNDQISQQLQAQGGRITAGQSIGDVMHSILGIPSEKLAYREQLQALPTQYAMTQAQLQEQKAKSLQSEALAARALGQNAATVQAWQNRGVVSEQIGANQRLITGEQSDLTKAYTTMMDNQNKLRIATMQDDLKRTLSTASNATKIAVAQITANKQLSPDMKGAFQDYVRSQDTYRDKILYDKMPKEDRDNMSEKRFQQLLQQNVNPQDAYAQSTQEQNTWDQQVANLYTQYMQLGAANMQNQTFHDYLIANGMDPETRTIKNVPNPQGANPAQAPPNPQGAPPQRPRQAPTPQNPY